MSYANILKLGTLTLGGVSGANVINNISKNLVDGTAKSITNGKVSLTIIPNKEQEMRIVISGSLQGTNRDADKSTLTAYSRGQIRRYEDGVDNGDYIIEKGSLVFSDTDTKKTIYPYTMALRAYP